MQLNPTKIFGRLTRLFTLLALASTLLLPSCVDQEFDEPAVTDLGTLQPNTTIQALKAKFTGGQTAIKINENLVIQGTVIADDASGNFFKNLVIQDATGGITVRLNATGLSATYPIGKTILVSCQNLYLADYNGVLQLNGSPEDGIEEVLIPQRLFVAKEATPISPRKVSIDQLGPELINTLIQIEGVQFKDGETGLVYADAPAKLSINRNLVDCSGKSLVLRSSGYASFAADKTPNGNGSIVGVYSVFGNTKQLFIRDLGDVKMSGARCSSGGGNSGGGNSGGGNSGNNPPTDPLAEFTENFSSQKDNQGITLSGWTNYVAKGARNWIAKVFSNNLYAQATSFGDSNNEMDTWLITPPIDLKEAKVLSFETARAFYKHDGLTVWLSSDFDGKNVASATWTRLNATIAGSAAADNAWVPSGDIALAANGGKAYVAFRYQGDKTNNTTTYRIDNVKVRK